MNRVWMAARTNLVGVRGIVFDMDGTLTLPILDFKRMRERLGVPEGQDILRVVHAMSEVDRVRSLAVIEEMEREAARNTQLQPGLQDLLFFLDHTAKFPRYVPLVRRVIRDREGGRGLLHGGSVSWLTGTVVSLLRLV